MFTNTILGRGQPTRKNVFIHAKRPQCHSYYRYLRKIYLESETHEHLKYTSKYH